MAFEGPAAQLFEAVADNLIAHHADGSTKHDVLATLMDHIGVPMMSIQRYRDDPAIVALFGERGVRFRTPEEVKDSVDNLPRVQVAFAVGGRLFTYATSLDLHVGDIVEVEGVILPYAIVVTLGSNYEGTPKLVRRIVTRAADTQTDPT